MGCAFLLIMLYFIAFGSILVTTIFHPVLGLSMMGAFIWTLWARSRLVGSSRHPSPAGWASGALLVGAALLLTTLLWMSPEQSLYSPSPDSPSFDDMRFLVKIAWTTYVVGGVGLALSIKFFD